MNIFFKTILTIFLTSTLNFAGDFYTESTIDSDVGADYVIIKDNRIVDIINKGLEYRVDIPVANEIPTVNAGSNKNICLGQSVTLSASASDSDGSITSYQWSENGITLSNNRSFIYTPATAGYHDIALTVRDNVGVANTDITKVYASTYPTVNAGPDKTITFNDVVNLSGSANDTDGSIASWSWNDVTGVNSIPLGTTPNISYKPTTDGIHTIRLTATDNIGCSKTDSMELTVESPLRPWAYTATANTPLQDIMEARIDHAGRREPGADADSKFGTSLNNINSGEDFHMVVVTYGSCGSTGMKLRHNGYYFPAMAYNYGSPGYDNNKAFWTVGKLNELNLPFRSRSYQGRGRISYHGKDLRDNKNSNSHTLDKWSHIPNAHYNGRNPGGCSDSGKGGFSAYILHGPSFDYLLNRLGVRNTPNYVRQD